MPFIILELLAQLACAYHCLKKGKEKRWLWLILIFPVIGSLLYFFIEILPDLQRGSPAGL